ncbi:MAG: dipeptidase [Planctomycetota bacterium]|jgi:dipeptidase
MSKKKILTSVLAVILVTGLLTPAAMGCFAVVVGRKASKDGSVLLGHDEQNGGQRFLNFRKIPRIEYQDDEMVTLRGGAQIPQVKETYSFLWSENPGLAHSDAYFNEWGLAVVSDACPDRDEELEKLEAEGQLVKGGITYMLRRLIVERARTAREGVEIAGEIIKQVGYPTSRTLVIADPQEAWLLSISRGKNWVAQRVGDDQVVLLPNVYIIGEINLEDKSSFLSSPGLVDNAIKKGWYNQSDKDPFSFCRAYSQPRERLLDLRQWRGQSLVTKKRIKEEPDRQLPFSVKPARKLSVKDVIEILRYHGKGGICSDIMQEAAVFQLRSNMPAEIGCVYWRCSAEPCTSVLTPWYCGISETPKEYYKPVDVIENLTLECHFSESAEKFAPDDEHAWWVFKKLQDAVRTDYEERIEKVRSVWDKFEAELFAEQPAVEKKALKLYRQDKSAAQVYLTKYSRDIALRAVGRARTLTEQIK